MLQHAWILQGAIEIDGFLEHLVLHPAPILAAEPEVERRGRARQYLGDRLGGAAPLQERAQFPKGEGSVVGLEEVDPEILCLIGIQSPGRPGCTRWTGQWHIDGAGITN